MKKALLTALAVVFAALVYTLGSGFVKEGGAFIGEYTISPEGDSITMDVGVISSMGFIRKVSAAKQQQGTLCLDCYCAFGGINGAWGAKGTHTIPLSDDVTAIALYKSPNRYETVLVKDGEGNWQRASLELGGN